LEGGEAFSCAARERVVDLDNGIGPGETAPEAAVSSYRPDVGLGVSMLAQLRMCFWLGAGFALTSAALAVLTLVWRDWVEAVTGFNPDRGNGGLEWVFVVGLALVCVLFGMASRDGWRRSRAAAVASI
jgi:hypothetical protein